MPMKFYAEHFAPWCERARWALDLHGISYQEIESTPVFSEVALRIAARRLQGRVTVPMLVDGRAVIMGSDAIARHVDTQGASTLLLLDQSEVQRWMTVSESMMVAGRALLLPRLMTTKAALAEQVPAFVPAPLRVVGGQLGVAHLLRKYRIDQEDEALHESTLDDALRQLRHHLEQVGDYLVGGQFTYADITMACALQFLRPVDNRYIRLGPVTREAWTHSRLAAANHDLFEWRDRIYARYRRREVLATPSVQEPIGAPRGSGM